MNGWIGRRANKRTNERTKERVSSLTTQRRRSFVHWTEGSPKTHTTCCTSGIHLHCNKQHRAIAKRGVGMHELVLSTDDLRCVVWVFRGLYGYACCVAREKLRGKEGRRHKRNDARCNDAMTRRCNDAMTRRCNDAMTRRCNHEMMQ